MNVTSPPGTSCTSSATSLCSTEASNRTQSDRTENLKFPLTVAKLEAQCEIIYSLDKRIALLEEERENPIHRCGDECHHKIKRTYVKKMKGGEVPINNRDEIQKAASAIADNKLDKAIAKLNAETHFQCNNFTMKIKSSHTKEAVISSVVEFINHSACLATNVSHSTGVTIVSLGSKQLFMESQINQLLAAQGDIKPQWRVICSNNKDGFLNSLNIQFAALVNAMPGATLLIYDSLQDYFSRMPQEDKKRLLDASLLLNIEPAIAKMNTDANITLPTKPQLVDSRYVNAIPVDSAQKANAIYYLVTKSDPNRTIDNAEQRWAREGQLMKYCHFIKITVDNYGKYDTGAVDGEEAFKIKSDLDKLLKKAIKKTKGNITLDAIAEQLGLLSSLPTMKRREGKAVFVQVYDDVDAEIKNMAGVGQFHVLEFGMNHDQDE